MAKKLTNSTVNKGKSQVSPDPKILKGPGESHPHGKRTGTTDPD